MRGGDVGGVAAANTSAPVISVLSHMVPSYDASWGEGVCVCASVLRCCGFHISPNLSQIGIDTWGVKWMPVPTEGIHNFKHHLSKGL